MRVLIINRALGIMFGGGEAFDLNAAKYLRKNSINAEILAGKLHKEMVESNYGIDIQYVSTRFLRKFAYTLQGRFQLLSSLLYVVDNIFFELKAFAWLIEKKKYKKFDIFQCCSLFLIPYLIIIFFRKPVVSWLPGSPSRLQRFLLKGLIGNNKFKLFTHGTTQNFLENECSLVLNKHFHIIEPGIELDRIQCNSNNSNFKNAQSIMRRDYVIGITVARLVPVKNHIFLIKALSQIKNTNWQWIFVGNGPEQSYLKSEIEKLGLTKKIHLLGDQKPDAVYNLLNNSDIFCLPSKFESFSISILEAMAAGLPIIATKGSYPEVILNQSKGGILVDQENSRQLSEAIENLIGNRNLRRCLSEKGLLYVSKYDWNLIVNKLSNIYCSLVTTETQKTFQSMEVK